MRTATSARLGLPRLGPSARDAREWLVHVLVALALAVALVAIVSRIWPEQRGLRALPVEERRALLSRTVDELRRYCGEARPEALEDHCRELASFAARFEECRGECEALVRHNLAPAPTR